MRRSAEQLRADAERIWRAGVAAVSPARLIAANVQVDDEILTVGDEEIDLRAIDRIAIVGAGKAAGAMAFALENALGPRLLVEKDVTGWVNVPADCVIETERVHVHAARPAGINEPRPEGVEGTRRILELVSSLGPRDLCFCLLTGGGSALLVAPEPPITLDDKIRFTKLLSGAGANIEQLNTVRRQLSAVKGGGLARTCKAGRLVTLIISDVLGDRLETIASGPTVESATSAADALGVLEELGVVQHEDAAAVVRFLEDKAVKESATLRQAQGRPRHSPGGRGSLNIIIGNNAMAVDAAGVEAERLGYSHAMISATGPEGSAEKVGQHLAEMALRMRGEAGPDCLISGGEPTVKLVGAAERGRGGRNQQLALAALIDLGDSRDIVLMSGGTDGEDGPTDAAGAIVSAEVVAAAHARKVDPREYLRRNDAYRFFEQSGGLIVTGPTHTNVCDLRVVVVARK
jgi:hydroxypyruvate reductase